VVKAAGEGEEGCNGVAGEVFVVAAAHVGDDDVALDQRIVEPGTAEPGWAAQIQRSFFARASNSAYRDD
jgi:hypothetical protein